MFLPKNLIVILEYNSSLADLIFVHACTPVGQVVVLCDFGATVFVMIVSNLVFSVLILYMCNLKGYKFKSLTSRISFSFIMILFLKLGLSVNSFLFFL